MHLHVVNKLSMSYIQIFKSMKENVSIGAELAALEGLQLSEFFIYFILLKIFSFEMLVNSVKKLQSAI